MLVCMYPFSVYMHIPFCRQRCGYCDFNTYAGQEALIPAYIDALCKEVVGVANQAGKPIPVHTIYFGGGTPSIVPSVYFSKVVETIKSHFNLLPELEMTLEANPGTVTPEYLAQLVEIGFNRISFGMQTADEQLICLLNRLHNFDDVIEAVGWARQAGFHQVNLDLIFGICNQSLASWQNSLNKALLLDPDHLSLYSLILEQGTPLFESVKQGKVPEPDEDLAADMYEWAAERLETAGFIQYEISNWAKQGTIDRSYFCQHNLQYWRNQPYFGFGAGAHGYIGSYRTANVPGIPDYIKRVVDGGWESFPFSPANSSWIFIDQKDEMQETMMVGLRLVQAGVSAKDFLERFSQSLPSIFGKQIDNLILLGLLEWTGNAGEILRLTRRGRLLGNVVFRDFVGDE